MNNKLHSHDQQTEFLVQNKVYLLFWNQTLICLGSMLERIGHSRISCCLRNELGFGHSWYSLSRASTCSGVYLTYLPLSIPILSLQLEVTAIITSRNQDFPLKINCQLRSKHKSSTRICLKSHVININYHIPNFLETEKQS